MHGVNLEVNDGETHVLIGPNASGKTTLAPTMIGYPAYKITEGRILFDGKEILNPPEIRDVKLRNILRLCAGLEPWNPSKENCETFASEIPEQVGK